MDSTETILPKEQANNSETSTQPALSLIEEARKEREETIKVLDEIKKQKAELEALHAKALLGGRAFAGSKQEPPKTEEQKIEEEAEAMMKDVMSRMGKI